MHATWGPPLSRALYMYLTKPLCWRGNLLQLITLTLPLHSALQHWARILSCKIKGWVGYPTSFLVTLILFTGNALRAVFCTDFLACPVEAAGATFLIAGEPEAVSVQLAHAQAVVIVTRLFVSNELENVSFKSSKTSSTIELFHLSFALSRYVALL